MEQVQLAVDCRNILRESVLWDHDSGRLHWVDIEPWTIDNGLLTPTLKLERSEMEQRFAEQIRSLYAEHPPPRRAEAPGTRPPARRRSS
jgi:hypothetical protein